MAGRVAAGVSGVLLSAGIRGGPDLGGIVVRSTAAGIGELFSAVVSGRDAAGVRAVTIFFIRPAAHAVRRKRPAQCDHAHAEIQSLDLKGLRNSLQRFSERARI